MRYNGKSELQRELSWFLIAYLAILLSVLLAVHLLQPAGEHPGASVRPQALSEHAKLGSAAPSPQ